MGLLQIIKMENTKPKFDQWAIVELMGHQKVAGKCTEETIAGANLLRVDIPETTAQQAFTKFFGPSAIYTITPVDEQTARVAADEMQQAPVSVWQKDSFISKIKSLPASEFEELPW